MSSTVSTISTDQAFRQFDATLAASGVRAGLAYLLTLTDYRFIAIFRFQEDRANAAVYVDRDHPEQLTTDEVPDTATMCCYVRDTRGLFSVADAAADPRTATHPSRNRIRAYCGVPVLTAEGELLGTLCYYDLLPRDEAQIDLPLLLQVASRLALGGFVPPYPRAA